MSPHNSGDLLNRMRTVMRIRHLALSTEDNYLRAVQDFMRFHKFQHPASLGHDAIRDYLVYLATQRNVASSTQNNALSALLFFYRTILAIDLSQIDNIIWAQKPSRIPAVFSRNEVKRLLDAIVPNYRLLASLLYGAGLRLNECLRLRIKDIDFSYKQLTVHDGKGAKDRVVLLTTG